MPSNEDRSCSVCNSKIDLEPDKQLYIELGFFKSYNKAEELQMRLVYEGYPAILIESKKGYYVQLGNYLTLEEAASMEYQLRRSGYFACTMMK